MHVSPIKEGNFFDFQLQSKDKYMRGVSFAPAKRELFQSVKGNPVRIKRFKIDQRSNTDDLLMSTNIEIQQLQEALFPKVEMPSTFDLGMLKTIAAHGQLITLKAKVTTLRTPALLQTGSGPLNMLERQIVDAKGYSKIIFWEQVNK